MTDKLERIEALREKEPRDLKPPTFYSDFTRQKIRYTTKLPVLIHGETVYVDDEGIWYAPTQAQADRLWHLMGPRNRDLNAFRHLPLQSAEVYAREAIRLLGEGRILFKLEWTAEDMEVPPGACP